MTTSLSRSFRLSSTLKIEEEAMVINKNQGISSILVAGSDCERSIKSSSSLRGTLSADMLLTKWLTQQGSSPMKKIASSEEFSISSITDSSSYKGEDEEEEDYDEEKKESDDSETEAKSQFDIWSSIQEEDYKKKELENPGQFDIWSSIISQKEQENRDNKSLLPSTYFHPLVRTSASSLSEKSLEICTESLGSETGSDGFSSYPPSETDNGDAEDDKEMKQEQQNQKPSQERVITPSFDFERLQIPKYNYVVNNRSSPQRSFPPPIPSLSGHDGASIRMHSRRNNGRLVLEAVSAPTANNFRALRQDGRLVLTFINSYSTEPVPKNEQVDELEEEFGNLEEEEKEEDIESEAEAEEKHTEEEERGEKKVEFVEQAPRLSSEAINVHRLTLMIFANRNPRWPKNFNEGVKFNEVEEDHIKPTTIVAQSLPSSPRIARLIPKSPETTASAAAIRASFNAYENYWRHKPMVAAQNKGKNTSNIDYNNANNKFILSKKSIENHHEQQQLVVLEGNKGDYLVPLLKSCKEPRRSLLFWEPYCAAIV